MIITLAAVMAAMFIPATALVVTALAAARWIESRAARKARKADDARLGELITRILHDTPEGAS